MPPTSYSIAGSSTKDIGNIDSSLLRTTVLARAIDLILLWFPNAKRSGAEFYIGNVFGEEGKSLGINPIKGVWNDHATGEGGDLIALFAALHSISRDEAAKRLWRDLGLDIMPRSCIRARATTPAKPTRGPSASEQAVTVSADDITWRWVLDKGMPGEDGGDPPVGHWLYFSTTADITFIVLRYNRPTTGKPGAKEFRPLSPWRQVDGSVRWRFRDPPGKLPLYHLDRVAAASVLLICEGEKAADAAQSMLPPGWLAITSAHGAQGAEKSDWTPTRGKRVIIWPDYDVAGSAYADAVTREIRHAH